MKKLFLIGLSSAFLFGSVYAATPDGNSACGEQLQSGLTQANGFIADLRELETTPQRGIGVKGISLLVASGGVTSMILTAAIDDQLHAATCDAERVKVLSNAFYWEGKIVEGALGFAS